MKILEGLVEEQELRERTLSEILLKIREETQKLCLREETFETRRHLFCEAQMSQDLEYDLLTLRHEQEAFRKMKRDFLNEMNLIHDEFVDCALSAIAEADATVQSA